jgi:hypothetical protein
MSESAKTGDRRQDAMAVHFALGFPTLVTWVYFVWLAGDSAGVQQASALVGKVIQFAFPLLWVVIVQRQRLRWQWPGAAGLASGAGFGMLVVAAMLLLYHA